MSVSYTETVNALCVERNQRKEVRKKLVEVHS